MIVMTSPPILVETRYVTHQLTCQIRGHVLTSIDSDDITAYLSQDKVCHSSAHLSASRQGMLLVYSPVRSGARWSAAMIVMTAPPTLVETRYVIHQLACQIRGQVFTFIDSDDITAYLSPDTVSHSSAHLSKLPFTSLPVQFDAAYLHWHEYDDNCSSDGEGKH